MNAQTELLTLFTLRANHYQAATELLQERLDAAHDRIAELEAELDWYADAEYGAVELHERQAGVQHV